MEFVLVAPILVVLLLISMYLTDLLTARMKLQEAARFAVWEMTSRTLSDYGGGNHAAAFALARDETLTDAMDRYDDLNSLASGVKLGVAADIDAVAFTMRDLPVDLGNAGYAPGLPPGGWTDRVQPLAVGGLNDALDRYGFNRSGKVQVEVSGTVRSSLMPERYLQKEDGGWYETDLSAMSEVNLINRYTMIVDGWDLGDGGDAVVRNLRAGSHNEDHAVNNGMHALHSQVKKMAFLGGDCEDLTRSLALSALAWIPGLDGLIPDRCVTVVVAHNYMPQQGYMAWRESNDCGYPGYPTDASAGLNNVRATNVLDAERVRCYDTAPFRETWQYANSNYLRMFQARGSNFMGCENAQADVPAENRTLLADDENDMPVECMDGDPG